MLDVHLQPSVVHAVLANLLRFLSRRMVLAKVVLASIQISAMVSFCQEACAKQDLDSPEIATAHDDIQTAFNQPLISIVVATSQDVTQAKAVEILRRNLRGSATIRLESESQAKSALKSVVDGRLDFAVVLATTLTDLAPGFNIYGLDFAFSDSPGGTFHFGNVPKELNTELMRHGVAAMPSVWRREQKIFASNIPLRSPADLRGATIETQSNERTPFEVVGANRLHTNLSPADALGSNSVDGVEVGWADVQKLNAPFFTIMNRKASPDVVVYNRQSFERLPAAFQSKLRTAFDEAAYEVYKMVFEHSGEVQRQLERKKATTILELDDASRQEWRTALAPMQKSLIAKVPPELIRNANVTEKYFDVVYTVRNAYSIQWNGWFDSEDGSVAHSLRKGFSYQFVLDLGRAGYPGAMSGHVGIHLEELLKDVSANQKTVSLLVRPVLIGGNLLPRNGSDFGPRTLTVDLQRLKESDGDSKLLEDASKTGQSPDVTSMKLSLAKSLSWQLVAETPGCAQIGVSIWDVAGLIPLDYLVVTVPVSASEKDPPPVCSTGLEGGDLVAGLNNLLNLSESASIAHRADIAIHFFDRNRPESSNSSTVAVLIERESYEAAEKDGKSPPIYAWELSSNLSVFLNSPAQLPNSIANARRNINSSQPYADVVRQMNAAIFNGRGDDDTKTANLARGLLERLSTSGRPPVILARYFGENGEMIYLPLSLLGADAPERVLPRRVTVVQPYVDVPVRREKACFRGWDFAIPKTLDDLHGNMADYLTQTDWRIQGDRISWYEDNTQLIKFVTGDGSSTGAGEAVVLLAHHNDGNFYFSANGRPSNILDVEVKRRFGPGSIAVLAACSTAGGSTAGRGLLSRLARQGVDSIVASPFQVDAAFGAQLAVSFVWAAKDVRERGSPTQLIDIFNQAVQDTIKKYKNHPGYSDMALEFQILGNYETPMCAP